MKNLRAVFPGSFDPLTNGHTDIIGRALKIFSHVHVAVLVNPEKNMLFSVEERVALIREIYRTQADRVIVETFSGLLVDYVKKSGAEVIIRGLRAVSDYDYEAQMALMNKSICEDVETLFLITREKNSYISSSLVKQVALLGGSVDSLVPPLIRDALRQKIKAPPGLS